MNYIKFGIPCMELCLWVFTIALNYPGICLLCSNEPKMATPAVNS